MNVVPLPSRDLQNIPAMLRKLADAIEAGEHGTPTECAVVLNAQPLAVFGFGLADGTVVHYLLACAQRRMEAPMLGGAG